MLKVQEIRELIKLIDQSTIDEFSYEVEGVKVKMKKGANMQTVQAPVNTVSVETVQPAAVQTPAPVQTPAVAVAAPVQEQKKEEVKDTANLHKITSPMVGTFYQSPTPDADAYVKAGSKVKKDSIVCIVEAMKLFNEIEAEIDGEIVEVLVKDGQLVEYGQPLFLVKPE
ncbi:acetyl-CoA carboxylase biotin carboxyl carrier protein [Bacillus massilinigeriensis]|uniref:acetyl-CoA carboxylase biotin carboxyl carrier protein n=1 Tax=Bacillus mediterraneensis TaxID=1805474 RepID=UPI0008F93388|nr:acetyl-CoA carboxylase biotin carboxyl carrier protein [Bacillus mediterraneensis]